MAITIVICRLCQKKMKMGEEHWHKNQYPICKQCYVDGAEDRDEEMVKLSQEPLKKKKRRKRRSPKYVPVDPDEL